MDPSLEGQRKPVTALFADVVDSTQLAEQIDPEDWSTLVAALVGEITAAVERYGGTVTQFLGDGVLAIFGAPTAHEDDPARAVRAALDALDGVRRVARGADATTPAPIAIRVGINSGIAIVGRLPAGSGSSYTAIGDAINVAARVQAAAQPGRVWVTAATQRLLGPAIETVDRGSITVKGKREPVHVFEVVRARDAQPGRPGVPGLHSPLVGRSDELRRLVDLAATVEAGRGRAALLVGEPGIGKSRLMAELRSATAARVSWLVVNALSYGETMPLHVIRQLARGLADAPADAPATVVASSLDELVAGRLADGHPATAVLLHLLGAIPAGSDGERLAALDSLALHAAYAGALRELVSAAVEDHGRPIAIAFEDLHWADVSSVELLVRLLPLVHERPVLLLATTRPDRTAPGWQAVAAARATLGDGLLEIDLAPLNESEGRELVGNLLRIESLPPALREAILARTDGNPFFLEELVRMLIDRGIIVRVGDRWEATGSGDPVDVPDTIHGLLLGRIDRLAEDDQRVLRAAAVLGREFSLRLLEAVAGSTGPALGRLEAAGLVELLSPASAPASSGQGDRRPEVRYAFHHALVQEAAYSTLLRRERQLMHLGAATALEAMDGDRRELAPELARHYEAAGATDRAVEYVLLAGSEALRTFSEREAFAFFERAVALLPDPPETVEQRRRRVEAGIGRFRAGLTFEPFEPAMAGLEAILPLAEELADPTLVAEIHLWISVMRLEGPGETLETSEPLRRSLDLVTRIARETGDRNLEAQGLAQVATSEFRTGWYRRAAEHFREAAESFEALGRTNAAAPAYGLSAVAHARLGHHDVADRFIARARTLATESRDPTAILDLAIFAGMVETERGQPARTIEITRSGIALADELGNHACSLVGNFTLGRALVRVGDDDGAAAAFERSQELASYCQVGPVANQSRAWLSALRARRGDGHESLAEIDQTLEEARRLHDRFGEAEMLRERAAILASGSPDDIGRALRDLQAAASILEEIEAIPSLVAALRQYASTLRGSGREHEAARTEDRATTLEMLLAAEGPEVPHATVVA